MVDSKNCRTFVVGEMAEWSIAAVLKTVVLRGTGGSNPSLSARRVKMSKFGIFFCFYTCRDAGCIFGKAGTDEDLSPFFLCGGCVKTFSNAGGATGVAGNSGDAV